MWIMALRWALPFVVALFPIPVIASMLVVVLRAIAKRTTNKLDDQLVAVLARNFNVPDEPVEPTEVPK